jgi:iron complex transport system ATP-binding protein
VKPIAPCTLGCRDIVFARGASRILDGASLALGSGDVVALLGVNGAGKSTLLRILLGLLRPQQGSVLLNGRPLDAYRRREVAALLAYVPQSHVATFPFTVRQVVGMGRLPHAGLDLRLGRDDEAAIAAPMERLRIDHLAARSYTELSGGERQRVLLARALAQQAPILVMDEPFGGLDFGQQTRLLALFEELAAEGHAILHTTHLPEHALRGASRAVLLQRGRVIADGTPDQVITAATMNAFYDVDMAQIDVGAHRFFVPRVPNE